MTLILLKWPWKKVSDMDPVERKLCTNRKVCRKSPAPLQLITLDEGIRVGDMLRYL